MQLCTSWGYETRFSISQHVPSCSHTFTDEKPPWENMERSISTRNSSPLFVAKVQKWACPGAKGRYAPGRHWMTKSPADIGSEAHTRAQFPFGNIFKKKHWICGITTGGNVEKISTQTTTGQCQANHFVTEVSRILASSSSQTHEMIHPNASNCWMYHCQSDR
jgi:hypothetical protein